MVLFRVTRQSNVYDFGYGGEHYPGRWHEKGFRVIYASQTRALAVFELIARLQDFESLRKFFVISSIEIPDDIFIDEIVPESLGYNWKMRKNIWQTRQIGSTFLKKREFLVLKVPSVLIPDEYNFIVNPEHPDFVKCTVSGITTF